VRAVPLLLQTGLLTVEPGQAHTCRPPNEYARASLKAMLTSALADEDERPLDLEFSALWTALKQRSPTAFSDAAAQILHRVPGSMLKGSKAAGGRESVRESAYHAALGMAIMACAPLGVRMELEAASMSGRADILVRFGGGMVWVLEIGVGGAGDAEKKLLQAQAYGGDCSEEEVLCVAGAPVQLVDHLHLPASEEGGLTDGAQPVAHEVQSHLASVAVADGRRMSGEGAGNHVHDGRLSDAGCAEDEELAGGSETDLFAAVFTTIFFICWFAAC
jgi:hypothetical protein